MPFYNEIDNKCNSIYESWGFSKNVVLIQAKDRLLHQYNVSRLSELPDNKVMIRLENGECQLRTVKFARFHHKSDKRDSFKQLTGITWKIEKKLAKPVETQQKKSKLYKNDEYRLIHQMRIEKKSIDEIIEHFADKDRQQGIETSKWFTENKKNLSNKFNTWLRKQNQALM